MIKTYHCTQSFDFAATDPKTAGYVFKLRCDTKKVGAAKADWWIDAPHTPPLTLWPADWNGECWTKVYYSPWTADGWSQFDPFQAWPVYEETDNEYYLVGVVLI